MQQKFKNWDGESEPSEDILKFICSYYCNKNTGSQYLPKCQYENIKKCPNYSKYLNKYKKQFWTG